MNRIEQLLSSNETIYAVCHEEDVYTKLLTETEVIEKARTLHRENNETKYKLPETIYDSMEYMRKVYGINTFIVE